MPIKRLLPLLQTQTAKDSAISFSGHISASLAGAVFFALAFRALGVAEFGIFSLAYATAVILGDFIDPAVNATLMRFIPGSPKNIAHSFIKHTLNLKVLYFLIIIPIGLIFASQFSLLIFQERLMAIIPLILITAATISFAAFISGVMRAQKLFLTEAIYTFAQPLLRLALMIIIMYLGVVSVQTVLFTNIAAYLTISAIGFYFITPEFLKSPIPAATKHQTTKFLPAMVVSATTGTITDRINLYITNYYVNLASVGLLSAVTRLFTPIPQLAGSLDSVLGSRFAGFTTTDQARTYLLKALGISSFLAFGLLGSNLVIKYIGLLMYGPEFLQALPLYRIFSVGYSLFLLQTPLSSRLLYYLGRADLIAKLSLIQLVTTVAFNLLLIPRMGLIGAAWAMVAVFSVSIVTLITMNLTTHHHSRP